MAKRIRKLTGSDEQFELAISLLGLTRMEIVPVLRRRGMMLIKDNIDLRDSGIPYSEVILELNNYAYIRLGFVTTDWEELKSCWESFLVLEDASMGKPYLEWLNEHGEADPSGRCWELPTYQVTIEARRVKAWNLMFIIRNHTKEFKEARVRLDPETYHY